MNNLEFEFYEILDEFETFRNVIMHNVFFEFSLLLIIDHLRLRMWVTMEDWKKDEEGSADE